VLLLCLGISSCASVPDKPFCTSLRPDAGVCVWSISGKQMIIDDKNLFPSEDGKLLSWYDFKIGAIIIPLETFKAVKKYFIKTCKKNKDCSENIDDWDRSMTTLETKATEK